MTEPGPTDSATFEVRRLARHRSTSLIAWGLALAVLIGIGVLGRSTGTGDPSPSLASDAVAGATTGLGPGGPLEPAAIRAIDLEVPVSGPAVVTTPQLVVRGAPLMHADHVVIALESRNNLVVDQAVVDVTDPDGGIRPEVALTFAALLDLPYPRPSGTMWVVVTAYDASGMPLGEERRLFIVGPIGPGAVNVFWHNPESR